MSRRNWSFPVELPVRYRLGDDPLWRTGVTQLLSESEAFIQSESAPGPATEVTMIVSLSVNGENLGGCVIARGTTRRWGGDIYDADIFTMVVEISSYRTARLARAIRDLHVIEPRPDVPLLIPQASEYRVH